MKKVFTMLCCVIIIIGLFCLVPNLTNSVEAKNNNKVIVGTWLHYSNGDNYLTHAIQFTENGELRLYYYGDASVKITKYTFEDNTLTFDGENHKCYIEENGLFIEGLIWGKGYDVFTRA